MNEQIELGRILLTEAISQSIPRIEIIGFLGRHRNRNYGLTREEDCKLNDTEGERVHSIYDSSQGRIWIITEEDRSCTTVLYPEEY